MTDLPGLLLNIGVVFVAYLLGVGLVKWLLPNPKPLKGPPKDAQTPAPPASPTPPTVDTPPPAAAAVAAPATQGTPPPSPTAAARETPTPSAQAEKRGEDSGAGHP
jgi:hypothetical protein